MANHKSAEKRTRQNEKRQMRNKAIKTRIKHLTKDVRMSSNAGSQEAALDKLNAAKSLIDKAAKKHVIHKKTAARKISRLSKLINAATRG
ncbi:MAG: 30S ribosomal protein S20 [Desulfobacterales bacterium]